MAGQLKVIRRTATVADQFVGEGYFDLALPIGMIEDLEDITGCGIHELTQRFATGAWKIKDLKETIRCALIGGGLDRKLALEIVNRNVIEGYLLEYSLLARAVTAVALLGPEEDPVGEPEAAPTTETPTAE